MTGTQDAILAAVIAEPGCDLHRLAFADLCEEHGDDARAEFIRVQVELARLRPGPEARGKASNLLERHRKGAPVRMRARTPATLLMRQELLMGHDSFPGWCPRVIADNVADSRYCRGFVSEVTLPCALWLVHGPALVRAAPLERVTLGGKAPYTPAWESVPPEAHPCWWWVCAGPDNADRPEALPRPLFRALVRLRHWDARSGWGLGFADRDAALVGLSEAALGWARAAPVAPPPPAG